MPRTEPPLLSDRPSRLYPMPSIERDERLNERIRLKTLWQPLYHCRYIDALDDSPEGKEIDFFQEGSANLEISNVQTSGQLSWPRRFVCHEIEYVFCNQPDESIVSTFLVGERYESIVPLCLFQRHVVKPWSYYHVLHAPVQIPSIFNFRLSLSRSRREFGNGIATCALNGYLLREVH